MEYVWSIAMYIYSLPNFIIHIACDMLTTLKHKATHARIRCDASKRCPI